MEQESAPKSELRCRIMHQTRVLFGQYGIKDIRMDDIAAALKISKRTLYAVFADKETLLYDCILEHQKAKNVYIQRLADSSANVLDMILQLYKNSVEAYRTVNKAFFEDLKRYPKVYELLLEVREDDSRVIVDLMKKGVMQGLFRSDINPVIAHRLVREQLESMVRGDFFKEDEFLEKYETLIFIYLRGISTSKGASELENFIHSSRVHKQRKEKA